ncbi:MAG: phenylalanine--tRNA ligase subunit beta, partial [Planctomycetota bacterium]
LACDRHPQADKLSLTQVDLGDGKVSQIVCGAPNVEAGQKVAVIQPGQRLPDGAKIKKSKIRGVESFGMILSEREMGISDEHEGILVLGKDAVTGAPLTEHLDLLDHVFEIDNKSINHRPDLWGHYGIARELAAIYDLPLRPLELATELPAAGNRVAVEIEDISGCPRYTGLVIDGVRCERSPDWMRYLLQAVGQRPINLLVDLTNFVMLEIGQPMHAFDLRQIESKTVGVRRANPSESMRTLDGEDRKLDPADLLITCDDHPVALAGIMGGEGTMVVEDTSSLFLESANFHPASIRRSSGRLGLRTDASARFEKSLDPSLAEIGIRRFLQLIAELCPGAKAAGPLSDPAAWVYPGRSISLRRARLDLKLGVEVPAERVRSILESLEFTVEDSADGWAVSIPSFRATKDIEIEDDLIEEVGRMFRYDNIPEQPLQTTVEVPPREPELYLARKLVQVAATEMAAHEVQNYSFVHDAVVTACLAEEQAYVRATNPVAPEQARMRRHVLPSLLGNLPRNLEYRGEILIMEEGKGYQPEVKDADGLPREVREAAFACSRRDGAHPYGELRAGIESLLQRLAYPGQVDEGFAVEDQPWIHGGRSAAIRRADRLIGYVGHLHPRVCRNLKIPDLTAIATLDLRAMLASGAEEGRYRKISAYPTQPVDVALLVPEGQRVAAVAGFLRDLGRKLVQSVELFEVYRGEGIPAGKKSLNFTVTLGANDRTLSSKDEEKYLAKLRENVGKVEAELRG